MDGPIEIRSTHRTQDFAIDGSTWDTQCPQVIAIQGDEVQLMDLESYEMFNVPIPEEFADALVAGAEVQYLIAMDRKKITKV